MYRFIIFIALIVASCKGESNQVGKPNLNTKGDKNSVKNTEDDQINVPSQYIDNDSLLNLLESDLDKITLNKKFIYKVNPKKNSHDNTIIDTIKTWTFDKTKICSYKATNFESIYSATIKNVDFQLIELIVIGMDKSVFEELINIKIHSDLLEIRNLEQTSVFFFKFKEGELSAIIYEGYVD